MKQNDKNEKSKRREFLSGLLKKGAGVSVIAVLGIL